MGIFMSFPRLIVSLEELDRTLVQTKNRVVSFHRSMRFVRKKLKKFKYVCPHHSFIDLWVQTLSLEIVWQMPVDHNLTANWHNPKEIQL